MDGFRAPKGCSVHVLGVREIPATALKMGAGDPGPWKGIIALLLERDVARMNEVDERPSPAVTRMIPPYDSLQVPNQSFRKRRRI